MNISMRSQHWLNSATLQTGNSRDPEKDHLYFCLPKLFIITCVYILCDQQQTLLIFTVLSRVSGIYLINFSSSNLPLFAPNSRQVNVNSGYSEFFLCVWMIKDCGCLVSRRQRNFFKGTFVNLTVFLDVYNVETIPWHIIESLGHCFS